MPRRLPAVANLHPVSVIPEYSYHYVLSARRAVMTGLQFDPKTAFEFLLTPVVFHNREVVQLKHSKSKEVKR